MKRTLTDAERIVSIREVIEAARGNWHEATALLSVGSDLHWLLARQVPALDAPTLATAFVHAMEQLPSRKAWEDLSFIEQAERTLAALAKQEADPT